MHNEPITGLNYAEKAAMDELCEKIQLETDYRKFINLVFELDILLERKTNRLNGVEPPELLEF